MSRVLSPAHFAHSYSLENTSHFFLFCHRLSSRGHNDWDQFLAGGSSWWWLWHQCSHHVLHVRWTARVSSGQPADRLGVCQPAHFTGRRHLEHFLVLLKLSSYTKSKKIRNFSERISPMKKKQSFCHLKELEYGQIGRFIYWFSTNIIWSEILLLLHRPP